MGASVVDKPQFGRDGQARADGDVLEQLPQRTEALARDLLGVRHTRDHAPRADEREHAVERCSDECDDAEREVEEQPDEAAEHPEEQGEPEDDDETAEPVGADLLLKGHGSVASETCGTAVSPSAEKNSRSRNPKGFAMRIQGMLCTAVLKRITVAL